jgi:hypothetical protein
MEFDRIIQVLCDGSVDFVVIGGVSALLHGSAAFTFDVDICYSRAAPNLRRIVAALAPHHPKPRGFPGGLPFIWDFAMLRNSTVLTLQTDLGELDLLAEVSGVGSWDDVKDQSVTMDAFERTISVLSLRGLIRAKRAAGRAKDLDALPELESLLEASE